MSKPKTSKKAKPNVKAKKARKATPKKKTSVVAKAIKKVAKKVSDKIAKDTIIEDGTEMVAPVTQPSGHYRKAHTGSR